MCVSCPLTVYFDYVNAMLFNHLSIVSAKGICLHCEIRFEFIPLKNTHCVVYSAYYCLSQGQHKLYVGVSLI